MAKIKTKKSVSKSRARTNTRSGTVTQESDNIYILKLVLYLILGSQWLRITWGDITIPLPVGLIIGFFLARSDRLSFDRKIAYAILLVSMFVGFWLPIGLEIVL